MIETPMADTQVPDMPAYREDEEGCADIMRDIHSDHRHVFKALRLFERFAVALEKGERPASMEPVQILLDYLAGPFHQSHHEKEDLLYNRVCEEHSDVATVLLKAQSQHEAIAKLNVTATNFVKKMQAGEEVDTHKLAESLRHLASAQAKHMLLEENQLLPIAKSVLQPEEMAIFSKRAAFMGKPMLPPSYMRDNNLDGELEQEPAATN